MKNLTRVLALVLALSLVLGTVAFASFTDVKAGDDYAEAIETLAALNIIKGYEDGTFGGEKAITRAEAVAIVNRIQGLEKAAAGAASASLYTDVAADHWALGDINLATQMGIISGDGNGKFRPEDQVSYQEMVKMLTCAVNYQPAVEDLGGWPTGYLVAAQTYGILEDTVNLGAAPANRAVVAQLTFNTLTAPLMVQEGFGTNKTYKVKDAEGATQTLLSEKLKIYKVDAEVTKTDKDAAEVGYAEIKLADETEATYEVKRPNTLALTQKVAVGNSTIGEKKGYNVVAYLQRNDDREWEVLYNTVKEGTNIEYVVAAADIEAIKTNGSRTYISVVDKDENETKYYIDDKTVLAVNGETVATGKDNINVGHFNYASTSDRRDGNVTFLYADNNDDAVSKIFIEEWISDVVVEVAPNGKSIFLGSTTINLDTEDNEKLVYSLTMDGKDIAITDLKEDDVVTYIAGNKEGKVYNYYKILVSRETVEGAVDAYYDDDKVYAIAGKEYEVSQSAIAGGVNTGMTGSSMAGKSGVFYLDAFGKIAGYTKTVESKGAVNYGYILNVKNNLDETNAFAYEFTARILTKDGIKDIDFADRVYVSPIVKAGSKLDTDRVLYKVSDPEVTTNGAADFKTEYAKFVGKDLVDYTVNSDGKISAIAYYADSFETAGETDYITKNAELSTAVYVERNNMIGKYAVDENTVIFYIGANDKEDYVVTDMSFLQDEIEFAEDANKLTVYGMDEDRLAGALLIRKAVASADTRGNLAVYVKYATVNDEDGNPITRISYYQGGELKTIDADVNFGANAMKAYAAGDVVQFTTNTKGILTEVPTIIADVENTKKYGFAYPELSKDAKYVFGQVVGKSGNTLKVGTSETDWNNHTVDADANVYIVELKANGKIEVTKATVAEITRNRFYGDKGPNAEKDSEGNYKGANQLYNVDDADNFQVVLKYIEGDVIDVVAYKNFLTGYVD